MSSTYNNTKELRFWCQKVLPLVYDDSLSYYELLNKIVVYLNSTIEDVQAMIADVTRIEQGLSSKIDLSQKGVANGVATLNGQGQVPLTQLPDMSVGIQTISVNGVNVPADANKNVNIIVMTNAVSNLVNYYLKSETYNKTEVNALIDSVKNSRFEVVTQLPTTDIQTNVIYLVPKSVGQTQNGYDEFINLDGTTSGWELIGSTDIDLSGYVTDSELASILSSYVTSQSLNTTLAGYVTSGALTTTLEGYVTQLSFQSLQNTVASQGNTLAGLITTVNSKVDKVAGKGLSTNDYTNEDKTIVGGVTSALAGKFPRSEQVVLGAKNILPNSATSKEENGLTFTVNSIGSITINGTSTADTTIGIAKRNDNFAPPNGSYTFSKGVTTDGIEMYINKFNNDTYIETLGVSSSVTENTFNIDYNNYNKLVVGINVIANKTIDNVTVYPMTRIATDPDDTYAPYVMTNKELSDKVVIANPTGISSTDLTKVQIGNEIYNIPSGSSGTTVVPNPTGTPTGDLTKVQIGNDIYNIPDTTYSNATTTTSGLMSPTDKQAINNLPANLATKVDKTSMGTNETGTTASKAYKIGEYFLKNSTFAKTIMAIASGATLTEEENYVLYTSLCDVLYGMFRPKSLITSNNADLNSYTENGLFYVSSCNPTNSPAKLIDSGQSTYTSPLLVFRIDTDSSHYFTLQVVYRASNGKFGMRVHNPSSDTWTAWKYLTLAE